VSGTVSPRNSAPTLGTSQSDGSAVKGAKRLLKTALLVLAVWLVGALALNGDGNLVHALLLVGLMLLLIGALKARDAARLRDTHSKLAGR
jgi:hypothetical protein